MLQAKTEEQKKWVKEFINSLPYFDKERRFSPCLYCSDVTNDGISIMRKYSEGSGWDEKVRSETTYISFDNLEQIVDHLRSVNKPKKEALDLSIVAPEMLEAVETWLAYKREKKQTYKPSGFSTFYKRLCKLSNNNPQVAMAIVEESMSNNYAGIFPLKKGNSNYGRPKTNTEKFYDTIQSANEFSQKLHERVGNNQAEMGNGDNDALW